MRKKLLIAALTAAIGASPAMALFISLKTGQTADFVSDIDMTLLWNTSDTCAVGVTLDGDLRTFHITATDEACVGTVKLWALCDPDADGTTNTVPMVIDVTVYGDDDLDSTLNVHGTGASDLRGKILYLDEVHQTLKASPFKVSGDNIGVVGSAVVIGSSTEPVNKLWSTSVLGNGSGMEVGSTDTAGTGTLPRIAISGGADLSSILFENLLSYTVSGVTPMDLTSGLYRAPAALRLTADSNNDGTGEIIELDPDGDGTIESSFNAAGDFSGKAATATALAADPAACPANQFGNDTTTAGALVCAQPGFANLSGLLALAQITDDATASLCLLSGGSGGDPVWSSCSGGASGDITDVGNCATGACFTSVAQNLVLVSPVGSTGAMTARALVDADITDSITASSIAGGGGTCPGQQWTNAVSPAALPTCSYVNTLVGFDQSATIQTDDDVDTLQTRFACNSGLVTATCSVTKATLGTGTGGTIAATTAVALATNPADCAANQYAHTIAASGALTCSGVTGAQVTGSVALATELAADGSNCTAGNFPLGIDEFGNAEDCTVDDDVPDAGDFGALALTGDVTSAGLATTIAANSVALTDDTSGNYVASANTSVLTGLTGGSAGSEGAGLTLGFDYSQALAGDVGLGAGACVFGVSGLVCEGATANTFESFVSFTDPTSDRTYTVPDRGGTVSLSGDTFTGDVTGTLNSTGATALTVASNAVALTDDTTGNYAAGDAEAGAALTGDSATSFFSSGTIEVARGGTGAAPGADDQVSVSDSTSAATWRALPDSDGATQKLQYDVTTNAFSAGTDDDVPESGDFTGLSLTGPITTSGGVATTLAATVGGRSLTVTANVLDADAELYTSTKSLTILSPTTADTNKVQWQPPLAITFTRVSCSTDTGTVSIILDKRTESTPNTAGTNMLSSALVCDNNSQTSCASGCDVNTLTSNTMTTRQLANLQITATASSPTLVRVHVEYTIDD